MTAAQPPWLAPELYPFRHRYLDAGGCRVHYVDEGTGPVLLFLHGNPTWSFLYRGVIGRLRGGYRCVALDYPGFGLSTAGPGYRFTPAEHAGVVERCLLALELTAVTAVLHDWGGPIGLAVAGRHPDRFRALVVANTFAWPVDNRALIRFSVVMGGPVGRLAIRYGNAFVTLLLPAALRRRPERRVLAAYRGPFADRATRTPMHVLPRQLRAGRDFLAAVERGLPALRDHPALILWGERDPALRAPERARFERHFPRHRTVLVPGAGHYLPEDAPGDVAAAIAGWHESLPAGAGPAES